MRSVINQAQFTPFGLWLRQYVRSSRDGISITNLDYVIEDFRQRKIMLIEEKQNGGGLHNAQLLTFMAINDCLTEAAPAKGYEYWGFYVLQFPSGNDMPGPGMKLNGQPITCEQLARHLNFERKHCAPLWSVP
jgi:hypothetical protein